MDKYLGAVSGCIPFTYANTTAMSNTVIGHDILHLNIENVADKIVVSEHVQCKCCGAIKIKLLNCKYCGQNCD